MQHARTAPGTWTGELGLEMRNGRDWRPGDLDLSVRRDTVHVRHLERGLAVIDRDRFRDWLLQCPVSDVLAIDDTTWTVQAGVTCVQLGQTTYTVLDESLANLRAVI